MRKHSEVGNLIIQATLGCSFKLDGYAARHADAAEPLSSWRKIFEKTNFADIHTVRAVLPTADFADPYKGSRTFRAEISVFICRSFTHAGL